MRLALDFLIAKMQNRDLRRDALDFSTKQFMIEYNVTRERAMRYHVLAVISYANEPARLKVDYNKKRFT